MDNNQIVSNMNAYLHTSSSVLVKWLETLLKKTSDNWWQECVIDKLSYNQAEMATQRGFTELGQFDLAALLRIADKNWYAFGLSSQNDPNALKFECAKPSSKTKNDQLELPKGMRFRSMKKNGLVLKGGEAGYIRITGQDVSGDNDKRMISFPEIKYNGMISVLDLDIDKMKGKAFVMSEYYQK